MTPPIFGSEAWVMGSAGEDQIREWLLRHGFGVITLAKIDEGGAPSLTSALDRVVLPDFQVTGIGVSRYVEIKTKSKATKHYKTNTWNHGIELRLYHQYLAIAKETGLEVWLCVFELERNLVLLQDTAHLNRMRREFTGPNTPKGAPFVYFPCDEFEWHYGPSEIKVKSITPRATRTLQQPEPPESRGPSQLDLWK